MDLPSVFQIKSIFDSYFFSSLLYLKNINNNQQLNRRQHLLSCVLMLFLNIYAKTHVRDTKLVFQRRIFGIVQSEQKMCTSSVTILFLVQ